MGVYGDWNTLCPEQTFTQAGLLKNFPNSTADPWTVLDTWGPTEHGSEGFTAYIPEMDKVTLVFKGDYNTEKNWPIESADITGPLSLAGVCEGCSANAYALAGYLEAVQATNGFENAVAKWKEIGCYFSVTGHGLGGAHSLLATLHYHDMIEFSHNFGTPRVLNPAAAGYYDYLLGGTQIDRGSANADSFVSLVPQSDDWAFTNTGVYYYGYNETYKMNMKMCFEAPEDTACMPQGDLNELDHYFYMSNVGQCGGDDKQDTSVGQAYIDEQSAKSTTLAAVSGASMSGAETASTASASTTASTDSTTSAAADVNGSDITAASSSTSTGLVLASATTTLGSASESTSTVLTTIGGSGGNANANTNSSSSSTSANALAAANASDGEGQGGVSVSQTGGAIGSTGSLPIMMRGGSALLWVSTCAAAGLVSSWSMISVGL